MIVNKYIAIGSIAVCISMAIAGYFYGTAHEARKWEAAVAKLQAEAATKLAESEAKARAKDNALSLLANQLDAEHAKSLQDIEAARADYTGRINDSLRRLAACRSSSGNNVPSPTPDPVVPAGDSTRSDEELSRRISERLGGIGVSANKLAATVGACVTWANEIGR